MTRDCRDRCARRLRAGDGSLRGPALQRFAHRHRLMAFIMVISLTRHAGGGGQAWALAGNFRTLFMTMPMKSSASLPSYFLSLNRSTSS